MYENHENHENDCGGKLPTVEKGMGKELGEIRLGWNREGKVIIRKGCQK